MTKALQPMAFVVFIMVNRFRTSTSTGTSHYQLLVLSCLEAERRCRLLSLPTLLKVNVARLEERDTAFVNNAL